MMNNKNKKEKSVSEFRKDLVSGEWILISTKRKLRPRAFGKKKCIFEDPQKNENPFPVIWHPRPGKSNDFKNWFIQIIPNKFPVLQKSNFCPEISMQGPYEKVESTGFHEVIITRDHDRPIHKMTIEEISLVLRVYRDRYQMLEKEKCIEYVLIFHNEGELAGASILHPHSQLVAMPIVPPDVSGSINGGLDFYERHKKCVHCVMLDYEKKEKKRIIYQNKHFIVIAPYASRVPYEMRIFPIKHSSDFEEISDREIPFLADALKDALSRVSKVLKNPDYNFFIHTSSARVTDVPYYHWHIEILPRAYKWAGLELGTGVEVVVVSPEEAAEQLRKAKNGKNK